MNQHRAARACRQVGARPAYQLRFELRAHLGDQRQDRVGLLRSAIASPNSALPGGVATTRRASGSPDRISPSARKRGERASTRSSRRRSLSFRPSRRGSATRSPRTAARSSAAPATAGARLLHRSASAIRSSRRTQWMVHLGLAPIGMHRQRHAVAIVQRRIRRARRRHRGPTRESAVAGNSVKPRCASLGRVGRERIGGALAEARTQIVEVALSGFQHRRASPRFPARRAGRRLARRCAIDRRDVEIERGDPTPPSFLRKRERAFDGCRHRDLRMRLGEGAAKSGKPARSCDAAPSAATISAVALSATKPGASRTAARDPSVLNRCSGTATVMPSSGAPGSEAVRHREPRVAQRDVPSGTARHRLAPLTIRSSNDHSSRRLLLLGASPPTHPAPARCGCGGSRSRYHCACQSSSTTGPGAALASSSFAWPACEIAREERSGC